MSAIVVILAAICGQAAFEPQEIDASLAGKRIVVRGVYGGQVGAGRSRQMKLQHCKAKFLPDQLGTEGLRGKLNLEITGVVRSDGSDVFVDMIDWKPLPSDVEVYSERASQIAADDFAGWYKLAEWAEKRIERYDPPGLAEKAALAYRTGMSVERRAAAGDPERLRQLGERMRRTTKLIEFDFDDLDHEILRAQYRKVPQQPQALRLFADKIGAELVHEDVRRLVPVDRAKAADYDRDPLATYRSAGPELRRRLARYFAVSVLQRAWTLQVDAGALEPLAASEEASRQAPDYPSLASRWAQRAAEKITGRLGSLSERQVVEATTRVERELRDPTVGKKLRLGWLELREQNLTEEEQAARRRAAERGLAAPAGDAQTRLELARIYQEWFPGDKSARENSARLLLEALAIDPSSESATEQLRALGYVPTRSGVWKPAAQAAGEAAEQPKAPAALRVGQRAAEVRASHGEPDAQSRLATARGVEHQWIYRGSGETLYLTLEQSREGDLRVREVRKIR